MATLDMRTNALIPSTDETAAKLFRSLIDWMRGPRTPSRFRCQRMLEWRSCFLDGRSINCAMVRATSLHTMSPHTMPRTPPPGFSKCCQTTHLKESQHIRRNMRPGQILCCRQKASASAFDSEMSRICSELVDAVAGSANRQASLWQLLCLQVVLVGLPTIHPRGPTQPELPCSLDHHHDASPATREPLCCAGGTLQLR